MIWTALISLLSGIFTGTVPELLKEYRDSRASSREREFLKLQHQLEMERLEKNADMKIREAETSVVAEEIKATREYLTTIIEAQARPTNILWIDAFNALIRPAVSAGIMLLFFWISFVYVDGLMTMYNKGAISSEALHNAVWGSLVGEGILATLGFLFGYKVKTAFRR